MLSKKSKRTGLDPSTEQHKRNGLSHQRHSRTSQKQKTTQNLMSGFFMTIWVFQNPVLGTFCQRIKTPTHARSCPISLISAFAASKVISTTNLRVFSIVNPMDSR